MIKSGVFIVFITVMAQSAFADIADTVIAIKEVVTKGVKFDGYSVGAKLVPIDSFQLSLNQMNSVAELFAQQSLVNVTSYGPGGHAGVKIRGGGADHTTIIWNGLNLKPPMSGEINYSAINAGVFDEIKIQPGGSSTMYGTGAATGVVFLANKLDIKNKGLFSDINVEAGSFDTYGVNAKGGYNAKNFGTRLSLGYQTSSNKYEFINTDKFGDPKETQEHAGYNTISLVQQNVFWFSPQSKIETDLWYSNHFKQIPSLTTDSEQGRTEQTDDNIHFALNYSYYGNNWYVKYRGGFLTYKNTFLGYKDEDSTYYSAINHSWSYINEVETKYRITNKHNLFVGVNSTIDKAHSSSYNDDAIRNQSAIFGRYIASLLRSKLQFNVEGRQAITDGKPIPFVYSAGINLEFINGLHLKALGAKLYKTMAIMISHRLRRTDAELINYLE